MCVCVCGGGGGGGGGICPSGLFAANKKECRVTVCVCVWGGGGAYSFFNYSEAFAFVCFNRKKNNGFASLNADRKSLLRIVICIYFGIHL